MLSVGFSLSGAGPFLGHGVVPLLIPRALSACHDALGLRLRGLIAAHHEESRCGEYHRTPAPSATGRAGNPPDEAPGLSEAAAECAPSELPAGA